MIVNNATLNNLRTALKKTFDDTYRQLRAESFYKKVAFVAPSSGASNTYGWLGNMPHMREWVGDRVIKDLKEHSYTIPNRLWEATLGVNRTDIEDDNLGMYTGLTQALAEEAATHPDRLIGALMPAGLTTPCYDGQNFFDTDHPVYENHDGTGTVTTVSNVDIPSSDAGPAWYLLDCRRTLKPLIFQERMPAEFDALTDPKVHDQVFMKDKFLYGARARHAVGFGLWQMAYMSRQPLTAENFRKARAAMRAFTGDGDTPLGIRPNLIVVPGALQSDAETLFKSTQINGSSNTLFNAVEIIDTDWLESVA